MPDRRARAPQASTSRDRILRSALWATAALDVLGAIIFALPALGHPSPLLPMAVPPYFAAQIGFTIALFVGEVPVGMALNATPDLVFAGFFFWWAGGAGRRRMATAAA